MCILTYANALVFCLFVLLAHASLPSMVLQTYLISGQVSPAEMENSAESRETDTQCVSWMYG